MNLKEQTEATGSIEEIQTVSKESKKPYGNRIKVNKDPLRDTILSFHSQGWDSNRIAANLMIPKQRVESITKRG